MSIKRFDKLYVAYNETLKTLSKNAMQFGETKLLKNQINCLTTFLAENKNIHEFINFFKDVELMIESTSNLNESNKRVLTESIRSKVLLNKDLFLSAKFSKFDRFMDIAESVTGVDFWSNTSILTPIKSIQSLVEAYLSNNQKDINESLKAESDFLKTIENTFEQKSKLIESIEKKKSLLSDKYEISFLGSCKQAVKNYDLFPHIKTKVVELKNETCALVENCIKVLTESQDPILYQDLKEAFDKLKEFSFDSISEESIERVLRINKIRKELSQ